MVFDNTKLGLAVGTYFTSVACIGLQNVFIKILRFSYETCNINNTFT